MSYIKLIGRTSEAEEPSAWTLDVSIVIQKGSAPVLDPHAIHHVGRRSDKEALHKRIVERNVGPREEVDIACAEDEQVEQLRFEADTAHRLGLCDLLQEDKDGSEMSQVTQQAEEVHSQRKEVPAVRRREEVLGDECVSRKRVRQRRMGWLADVYELRAARRVQGWG